MRSGEHVYIRIYLIHLIKVSFFVVILSVLIVVPSILMVLVHLFIFCIKLANLDAAWFEVRTLTLEIAAKGFLNAPWVKLNVRTLTSMTKYIVVFNSVLTAFHHAIFFLSRCLHSWLSKAILLVYHFLVQPGEPLLRWQHLIIGIKPEQVRINKSTVSLVNM
jgi:hypothetical protein